MAIGTLLSRLVAALPMIALSAQGGQTQAFAATIRSGRPILYQSQAPGGTEDLRSIDPRSGRSRLLLRGDSSSSRGLAARSPDGRQVAYVREYNTHDELYLFDPLTRAERRIGIALPAAVMFPEWSPSGMTISVSAGDTPDHVGVF